QRAVAAARLVYREVALEHRPFDPERRDAGLDIGPPQFGEPLRGRRQLLRLHVEPEHPHAEPAELYINVRAGAERADMPAPFGEDLVALPSIGAEPDRPADVVEHNRRFGEGARQ